MSVVSWRRMASDLTDQVRELQKERDELLAEVERLRELELDAPDVDELIEARALSGFCGYCGITPGHSVGCPVARAEALQSMLTGDALSIIERAEAAEAKVLQLGIEKDAEEYRANVAEAEVERLKKEERGLRLDRYNLTQRAEAAEAEVEKWKEDAAKQCAVTMELEAVEEALKESIRRNVKRAEAAEAEVERLRVCGNCERISYWHEDIDCTAGKWTVTTPEGRSWETSGVDPGDPCHFTPSRWQRRQP